MSGHHPEEVGELLALLESPDLGVVRQIQELITENLNNTKDAWLLNGLVDFYMLSQSQQCLVVLTSVSEQHHKHLLDRLVEHLRGNNKLATLTALGFLIRRQLPWLHKVVNHPLLSTIIKCLKSEADVPVLLTGLLDIAALLPLIPVTICQHLPDIFLVFSRMAAFNLHKPGNVPDVYLLHLQVGTYSLFHRLYGMYPCHFLTYLRSTYSRKENTPVFNHTIKPMLATVRVHPLLVTATKDREVATDRWRQMEVQDIIADCSKLALDPIEGSCEHPNCPITAFHSRSQFNTGSKKLDAACLSQLAAPTPSPFLAAPSTSEEMGLLGTLDSSVIWSPATKCGLSTPPLLSQPTPETMARITPSSTPVYHLDTVQSQVPHPDDEKPHSGTPTSDLSKRRKRLSGFTLSLAGKITTPTDLLALGSDSVPPSPLKPNFTCDPPFTAQRMQAIRKLQFQPPLSSGADQPAKTPLAMDKVMDGSLTQKPASLPESTPSHSSGLGLSTEVMPASTGASIPTSSQTLAQVSMAKMHAAATASGFQTIESEQEVVKVVPSVSQLPSIINNLGVPAEEARMLEAVDNEVLEIVGHDDSMSTSSGSTEMPSHLPSDTSLTAASVAAFMKKANRIRFNTVSVVDKHCVSAKPSSRPRSCPSLTVLNEEAQGHDRGLRSRERSGTDLSQCSRLGGLADRSRRVEFSVDSPTQSVDSSAPAPESISIACQTTFSLVGKGRMAMVVCDGEDQEEGSTDKCFPYDFLFPLTLPFASMIQCFTCAMNASLTSVTNSSREGVLEPPLYTCFSAPDLLDRHLERGGDIHAKQLNHLPLPSKEAISWTHFGGMPPADEVAILRGQIHLLHNQLMFERNRRELHAKRNRRLLGRIVKTVAMEEQTAAMKEQLGLEEKEIASLSSLLVQQQSVVQQLKADKDSYQCERELLQKRHQEEMNDLKSKNLDLESELEDERKRNAQFSKELQTSHAREFDLSQELRALKVRLESSSIVKGKLERCERELVLMGEVQEKYKQRLVEVRHSHMARPAADLMLEVSKAETAALKKKLHHSQVNLDITKAKLHDLEQQMKVRDSQVLEQQEVMDEMRVNYQSQLKAVEEKHSCQKQITAALDSHVLSLYNQIGLLQKPSLPDPSIPGPAVQPETSQEAATTRHLTTTATSAPLAYPVSSSHTASSQLSLPMSSEPRVGGATCLVATAPDSDTEVAMEADTDIDEEALS